MTVLIAGAGIAGLTLALSLRVLGIPARVFEAVERPAPLGVGINVQPHAIRELEALGLLPDLDRIALRTAEVAYFSSHGRLIWSEPRGMDAGYNWPQFSIHRGKLQMLMLETARARGCEIVTGARVTHWQETENGIEISLAGGSTATGSVFVAADGIHSAARARLHPDEGPPKWNRILMWRGTAWGPKFLTGRSMAMAGCKQRKFVCYPIAHDGDRALINWIADLEFPADHEWKREDWNRPGRIADLMPHFGDWRFDWLDVAEVIRGAEAVYEYPMVDRDPLAQWTHGRMTLMGDAAHPMYPIGSNGASQAILDARTLAREFRDRGATAEALAAYEAERRPKTAALVEANRGDGPDKVLDVVEARAPQGFDRLDDVITRTELEDTAAAYKRLAGMDIERLNASPTIL